MAVLVIKQICIFRTHKKLLCINVKYQTNFCGELTKQFLYKKISLTRRLVGECVNHGGGSVMVEMI